MIAQRFIDYDDEKDMESGDAGRGRYKVSEARMLFSLEDLRNFVDFIETEVYLNKDFPMDITSVHWQDKSPLFRQGDTDVELIFASPEQYVRIKEWQPV